MSRAHTIYVVLRLAPACMGDHLIAAFTVKRELKRWWGHNKNDEYEVWRTRDGCSVTKSIILRSELES